MKSRLVTPTFALVTASSLAYFIGIGMLLPTLPRYVEHELGGGGLAVGFVTGAFAFTAAVLRPFAGRIGDRSGRRILVLGGAAILAISYVGYVTVDALVPLVLLRIVSGVGEAAMFVGAATAIQDLAPSSRRGEAASYFSVALYVDHHDLGDVGPLFAVYGGLILTLRLAGARLADGFGAKRTATASISFVATGMVVIAAWHSLPGLYAGTILFAMGMALQYPALMRLVIDNTPDSERSSAIATFSIFFDLSQGVGLFVLGGVVAVSGSEVWAFAAAAVLSASALLMLRRTVAT